MLFLTRPAARFRLLATILALSTSVAVSAKGQGRMSDQVAEYARSGGPEMVDVIVSYKSKPSKADKEAQKQRVTELGGETKHAYGKLSMRSMSVPASTLNELAKEKGVRFVSTDEPLAAASTTSLPSPVGHSFPAIFSLPYSGDGVGVARLGHQESS